MAVSFNRYLILPEIEKSEFKVSQESKYKYTDEHTTRITSNEQKTSVTPATVPLCVLGDVQLRFLCPDDLEEVRALCQDWFPIGTMLFMNMKLNLTSCAVQETTYAFLLDIINPFWFCAQCL